MKTICGTILAAAVLGGPRSVAAADALERVPLVAGEPLMLMRLRAPHTADDAQWAKTFKALADNRGACDEVWFSTGVGFPEMDWHREHVKRLSRYASELRGVGIVPSLQFQATIGHGDEATEMERFEGKTWSGFTGSGGVESKRCNCPRQGAFLDYMRGTARLYASFRPAWVWIDDDLRINNHSPASAGKDIGCWCPTCLAAFNAETDGKWTRETLAAAIAEDATLYDAWERFSFAGIAEVARTIAEAVHGVSPETRLGLQHCWWRNDSQLAVFNAMHEATGLPVGSRPGGGMYYDQDPNQQPMKAVLEALQMKMLGAPEWIGCWCPEVETWPRAFASRTIQGILVESLTSLAYGMNSLSFLIVDTRSETDEWYAKNLLAPLAAERGVLEGYRDWNRDTVPAGISDGSGASADKLYYYALTGVPVVPGAGKSYGSILPDDLRIDISSQTSRNLCELRRQADGRAGGRLPVIVRDPSVGLVVPRLTKDGRLKSVMMLNARIDVQKPTTLLLRGVASEAKEATWQAFRNPPVTLPLRREDGETLVTLPEISAWNAGWLAL